MAVLFVQNAMPPTSNQIRGNKMIRIVTVMQSNGQLANYAYKVLASGRLYLLFKEACEPEEIAQTRARLYDMAADFLMEAS